MTSNSHAIKLARNVLIGLLFFNLSSVFIQKSGGLFNNVSYTLRIFFYLYVLYSIRVISCPRKLNKNVFVIYGSWLPFFITFSLAATVLASGGFSTAISRIFPTYLMLADTMLFFYIGYSVGHSQIQIDTISRYLHLFAVISIVGMTGLSIYVYVNFGGLQAFWREAYSTNHAYDVILNVYKNVNPYRFAVLIPFLFLKRSKLNVALVVVALLNIIFAGKKGPLLAVLISGLAVFMQFRGGRKKFVQYLFVGAGIFLVFCLFTENSIFDSLIYRLDSSQHMKKDDTTFYMSGRDYLWRFTLEHFFSGGVIQQMFGYGVNGAADFLTKKTGISNVHNDWLEVLHNFGYFGFFTMLNLYLILVQFCIKLKKYDKKFFVITLYLLIFSLVSSFYTVQLYGGLLAPGYSYALVAFFYGIYSKYRLRNDFVITYKEGRFQ